MDEFDDDGPDDGFCDCGAGHSIDELDSGRCDCCGGLIDAL